MRNCHFDSSLNLFLSFIFAIKNFPPSQHHLTAESAARNIQFKAPQLFRRKVLIIAARCAFHNSSFHSRVFLVAAKRLKRHELEKCCRRRNRSTFNCLPSIIIFETIRTGDELGCGLMLALSLDCLPFGTDTNPMPNPSRYL